VPLHSGEVDAVQQISVSQPLEDVLSMTWNANVQLTGLALINKHSSSKFLITTFRVGREFYTSILYKLAMEEE
jgi:hypothetical protein